MELATKAGHRHYLVSLRDPRRGLDADVAGDGARMGEGREGGGEGGVHWRAAAAEGGGDSGGARDPSSGRSDRHGDEFLVDLGFISFI